jgi:aldose 1-epimerase
MFPADKATVGAPSGQQWRIAADGHQATVVAVGGGLREYRWDSRDLIDGYPEHEMAPHSAGAVLAPWPNRIRDGQYSFGGREHQLPLSEPTRHNAIHGLVNWVAWECELLGPEAVVLGHTLPPRPGYPWPLRLRTRWSVGPDGLRADHEVTNHGGDPAPFGLGAHPYLRLGVPVDQIELTVPAASRLLVDARQLPIGAAKVAGTPYDFSAPKVVGSVELDTAFGDLDRTPDGRSTITLRGGDLRVRVWADANFRWWQIYSGDTLPADQRRRAIAVEPMTCPPDAFRSRRDLIELAAGQTWQASWGINPELIGG